MCRKHVSLSCWCSWLHHYGWTWVESNHLWVGCICLEYALYILVVTLGMSGPICEWGVSTSSVHYVFLLSLSAWVDPSVSGMYLPWVCIICSCCQSRHEWTHLREGCICLECALCVLVVTFGMNGPIWEWDVSASSVRYMFLLSLGMSGPICEWDICLECAFYVLVVNLGMSGPICEWDVSALECVLYVLVVKLGMSGPIWEWGVICLECALCVLVVTLGMSGPIWE